MRVCPKCQKTILNDYSKTCIYCGSNLEGALDTNEANAPLEEETPIWQDEPAEEPQRTYEPPREPRSSSYYNTGSGNGSGWGCGGTLVVILFVAIIKFGVRQCKHKDSVSYDYPKIEIPDYSKYSNIQLVPDNNYMETDSIDEEEGLSDQERALKQLENDVAEIKAELPENQGDGFTFTNIALTKYALVFYYVVDENVIDISLFEEYLIKQDILESIRESPELKDMLISAQRGMCKVYTGNISKKTYQAQVGYHEF